MHLVVDVIQNKASRGRPRSGGECRGVAGVRGRLRSRFGDPEAHFGLKKGPDLGEVPYNNLDPSFR